jgi:hypothetical protein
VIAASIPKLILPGSFAAAYFDDFGHIAEMCSHDNGARRQLRPRSGTDVPAAHSACTDRDAAPTRLLRA